VLAALPVMVDRPNHNLNQRKGNLEEKATTIQPQLPPPFSPGTSRRVDSYCTATASWAINHLHPFEEPEEEKDGERTFIPGGPYSDQDHSAQNCQLSGYCRCQISTGQPR